MAETRHGSQIYADRQSDKQKWLVVIVAVAITCFLFFCSIFSSVRSITLYYSIPYGNLERNRTVVNNYPPNDSIDVSRKQKNGGKN